MTPAERSKLYRKRHPEKVRDANRAYARKNREKRRLWLEKNWPRLQVARKEYNEAHRERISQWVKDNPERVKAAKARYRQRNRLAIKLSRDLGVPMAEARRLVATVRREQSPTAH